MIKELLNNLTDEQREQLMHAFENDFDQYIELEDNKFIGVNVTGLLHLKIIEIAGNWAYGEIIKETINDGQRTDCTAEGTPRGRLDGNWVGRSN